MTFLLSSATNDLAINLESVTILKNSSNNVSISAGTVVPWGAAVQAYKTDTYSVSNGVITLPSGYFYLIKCALSIYTTFHYTSADYRASTASYQFYDTSASAYMGRRGWVAFQEQPKLTGGDEYAIALIDASSSSYTVDLRVSYVSRTNMHLDDNTDSGQYIYAGYSRCEIYKWS